MAGVGLVWDLIAKDQASPAFLRVAGAADKAAASTAKVSLGLDKYVAKAGKLGATLTKSVTLPVLAIGAVAVDQAVKWQKSMTLIQTAGGETAAKTAAISKGLLTVAQQTGTSLSALSEGIYTVAKAGSTKWSATDQLLIMKAAAEGAKAENVDLGTATNALTSVMMSYHLGASKAVATENELIVGAGRAKTTMQEYAASLASVVPVASAAGIKFDQIAGAIATLTQHGTSAQDATQELAFTIRNLQAPNNVAIAAMNQLGISSVNVAKNLGTRGLSGTLTYIESFLPKTGLVYLDAMKKMESGTADLNQMLSKMPPNLAAVSKQFLAGTLGFTDYRKAFRGLGAEGSAQGAQFATLAQKVKGYNDQLKLGTPAQKTMASQLKQIFGGAVGLNTALQLGGENMAYFKSATDAVGKAALATGSDVLGWNKTQDTLAVKMDKAKASLQVLAVEIGTALIPAVAKIVGWVTKAVQWFENLSGTDKKILAWSVGVMAALGPILTIGTRLATVGRGIGKFAAGAATQFASWAGATETAATRVTKAMRGATAAIAGIGIGLAIGTLTQNSSTATKAIGALGAAAAGAAVGFGAGGGLGAVIGGVAGGLTSLATGFFGAGKSAQQAAANVQSFTSALQADSGALGKNLDAAVALALQNAGALDAARKLGLNLHNVTLAAEGNTTALNAIKMALVQYSYGVYGSTKDTSGMTAAARTLLTALGATNGEVAKAVQSYKNQKAATDGATSATRGLSSASKSAAGGLAASASSARGATVNLNGTRISASKLSGALGALRGVRVDINTSAAQGKLNALQATLNGLFSSMLNPPSIPKPRTGLGTKLVGSASGTNGRGLPLGVSTVGEAGAELAINTGRRVEILSHDQSRAYLAATGMRAPGFAGGTVNAPLTRSASTSIETSELRLLTEALADVALEMGRVAQRPIDLDGKPFRAMADDRLEAAFRKLTTVKKHGRR